VARDKEIVIVSGARTPMTEWIGGKRGDGLPGGALASVSAIELGAIVPAQTSAASPTSPGANDGRPASRQAAQPDTIAAAP